MKHGDTFRAHAWKFNHELVLWTVRNRAHAHGKWNRNSSIHRARSHGEKRAIRTAKDWNSLPQSVVAADSSAQFKSQLVSKQIYTVRTERNDMIRARARTTKAPNVFGAVRIYW